MPARLFVYGTLMPGHLRWGILAPHARDHRPATVRGTLYDTGQGWPSATFEGPGGPVAGRGRVDPAGSVPGWIVGLHEATAPTLLAQLDEIEGVVPDHHPEGASLENRYRRRSVTTDEGEEAVAYEAAWVGPTWVPIERWTTQAEQ